VTVAAALSIFLLGGVLGAAIAWFAAHSFSQRTIESLLERTKNELRDATATRASERVSELVSPVTEKLGEFDRLLGELLGRTNQLENATLNLTTQTSTLVTALRNPTRWQSLSAFAPIANPVAVPWGKKAFGNYLGPDTAAWQEWDASILMRRRAYPGAILIDQGQADQFLAEQLHPEALEAAAAVSGQALTLRRHERYDHSYWFIQTFIADHLAHHAKTLL